MNAKEKVSYVKALVSIATADERIEPEERQYFSQIGQLYGISDSEMEDIIDSVLNKKESIEEILSSIGERGTKLLLIYELLALCYADNKYSIAEKNGMKNICRILGIEDEKLAALEGALEESIKIQEKINTILER